MTVITPRPVATLAAVPRPSVDVVVPFRGSPAELEAVRNRLAQLRRDAGDSVVVVDNTPRCAAASPASSVPVLRAAKVATPGYARNRGAERGSAQWLVFIDADTVPAVDLLDRYFDPPPEEHTALLGGGILDEAVPARAGAVARYSYIRGAMSQDNTFRFGRWGFPQTANAACRRSAFEAVGGFREDIRAAEDADLTYRLRAAGWGDERRERATVVHRSRPTLSGFIAQNLCHGAGGAWLDRQYPGSIPPRRRLGLAWWGARTVVGGLASAVWSRDRDAALRALLDPVDELAYELGRSLSNERPARRGPA